MFSSVCNWCRWERKGNMQKTEIAAKVEFGTWQQCLHGCWLNFRGRESCWRIYHLLFFLFEYSELSITIGVFSNAFDSHIMCINNMAVRCSCYVLCVCVCVCDSQLLYSKIVSFQKVVSGKFCTSQRYKYTCIMYGHIWYILSPHVCWMVCRYDIALGRFTQSSLQCTT